MNLRKLNIELNHCYRQPTSLTFPSLIQIIKIAPTLNELCLRVTSSRRLGAKDIFDDNELLGIVQGLNKLIYLKSLHIELRDCQKMSNQGIGAFSNVFSKLTKLKEFSFSMIQNANVTDDIIAGMLGSLWKLSELSVLTVDLTGSYQIGDCSVNVLAEALNSLPKFQKLCIRLDGCQMGLKSLSNMLEAIGKLNGLEELEFSLGRSQKKRKARKQLFCSYFK